MPGEPPGREGFAWVGVLWALDARRDVVDNSDGFAVWVSRQRVGDDVVLHLSGWLVASFDAIYGLASRTLQATILVAIVVHGNQALQVVLMAALGQAAHRLSPRDAPHTRAFIARGAGQGLHADSAVLLRRVADLLKIPLHHFFRGLAFASLFLGCLAAAVA